MPKQPLLYLALAAVLLAPVLMLSKNSQAQDSTFVVTASTAQEQPVVAAMFYSNWCAACQILDPRIEAVKPAFEGHSVEFVKFDFSYALMRGKALKEQAEQSGVPNIYAKNKGRTGFMLLIDPATEAVLEIITLRDSKAAIAAKLERSMHRPAPQDFS